MGQRVRTEFEGRTKDASNALQFQMSLFGQSHQLTIEVAVEFEVAILRPRRGFHRRRSTEQFCPTQRTEQVFTTFFRMLSGPMGVSRTLDSHNGTGGS